MAYPTVTQHPRLYPYTSIMAAPYSCDPTGATDCAAAIEQMKSDMANVGSIHIPKGTFLVDDDLTIPIGMSLVFEIGGIITVSVGNTLIVSGYIVAGPWQIFSGAGTVSIAAVNTIQPAEWSGGSGLTIVGDLAFSGGTVTLPTNPTLPGTVTCSGLTPAGYVKNSAAGALSTGAIAAGDLPAAINAAKIGSGNISNAILEYLANVTSDIQAQINALMVGGAIALPYGILQNRQNAGTDGGAVTSGAWRIVPLNVEYEDINTIIDASALPAFSLDAGTYDFDAVVVFVATSQAQTRLYNVTAAGVQANDNSLAMLGSVAYTNVGTYEQAYSYLKGTFTLTGTKQLRLEYYTQADRPSYGFGASGGFGVNVYAQVRITQTA